MWQAVARNATSALKIQRRDDAVGNPHRAQISQFDLFELILLLKLDKQLPVEQFKATVSQSSVPSLPLKREPASQLCEASDRGARRV